MSFIGSRLRTLGTTSNLFGGGGDWVNHYDDAEELGVST
jgi:hypothetical protein